MWTTMDNHKMSRLGVVVQTTYCYKMHFGIVYNL